MMLEPMTAEFGIMMVLLSGVAMMVEKRFISSIVPLTPAVSTKSPTLKGRKMMISTAAPMFESESLSARPIASEAAPKIAKKDAILMPSVLRAANNNDKQNKVDNI